MVWRTDDIGRCQSGRTPELRAFGSYPCADAAINSWLRLGPYTASTDWGSLTSTDHGVRDRRAENLPQCPGGDPRDETNGLRKWDQTGVDAKDATTPGFTGFRGFEWTSDLYGHINVYFSKNFANAKIDGYPTPKTFYDWLSRRPELGGGSDGIATFNHPGAKDQLKPVREGLGLPDETSRNWNDFAYDARVDDAFVGMEVFNDLDEYGASRDYPEGYMSHVLDKGWHVAPVGAEDLGHRRSDDWGGPRWAKTVLLATDRSAPALKAAMRARRMYAVRDGGIRLGFHVDGQEMGSRLVRRTGSPLQVRATATWPGHSGLTAQAAHPRLVNQDARMRQAVALALAPAGE